MPPKRTSPLRSGDAEDGVFFFGVAADEFVGLADGDAFDHAGEGFEHAEVERAFVAGDADGGAEGSGDGMSFEAEAIRCVRRRRELVARWRGTA